MLTPRENLLRTFSHEQPEWLPVTVHVDPYNQPGREGIEPDLDKALGVVQWGDGSSRILAEYLGLDVMDYFTPPITTHRRKVTVERIDQPGGWVNIFRTPCGELREVHKTVREDGTSYCVEHLVKSEDDLPAFMAIFDDEEYSLQDNAAQFFRQRRDLVGDRGMTRSYMPATPLGMMVRKYSGVETLAFLWAEHREALHQLFGVMEEKYIQQFKLAASLGYDLLFGTDDTSTSCISPAMFEEFCLGYTDHVVDAVHAYGCRYVHHSCGLIANLLDLYRQTRMDAVDALTLKPVGDIERLYQAKEKLGGKITILTGALIGVMGNITEHQDDVREKVAEICHDAAPGDNIVLRISAFPHISMKEMAFIAGEYKKYQRLFS